MSLVKTQQNTTFDNLQQDFGYTNKMAAPKIEKVVISAGTGNRAKLDSEWNDFVMDRLAQFTGQKPALRPARQSLASFKIRQGDSIGQIVTLRGARMYDFLDKLIHIALPRTKDFRGIKRSAVDAMGNMTIGVREHTIFPETSDEELKNVFGVSVTVVTTTNDQNEALRFFEHLGFPLQKRDQEES